MRHRHKAIRDASSQNRPFSYSSAISQAIKAIPSIVVHSSQKHVFSASQILNNCVTLSSEPRILGATVMRTRRLSNALTSLGMRKGTKAIHRSRVVHCALVV
jgi:hypothetical protein